jgi:hypothetical protein
LISLLVSAKEKKSFLGLRRRGQRAYLGKAGARSGRADAAADRYRAGGRVGGRLRAVGRRGARGLPHLQKTLAEKATVDLKPFAANAQKRLRP